MTGGEVDKKKLLASAIEAVMTQRNWSLRRASLFTGIPPGTINNMLAGLNVGPEHVARFARRVAPAGKEDERAATWLALAGWDELTGPVKFIQENRETPGDPLLLVAEDIDGTLLFEALGNVVDVGANLERLTPDDTPGEPIPFGGPIRVMRIRHDCMKPVLKPGDVVFIMPPEMVKDGDIVIAAVDVFNRTCKRIRIPDDGASYLEPINGEGIIPEARFTVLGVVKYKLQSLTEM